MKGHAICDGRGNAGTGARAAVLKVFASTGQYDVERAEKIPATTNIVAEHLAIQLAMELAIEEGVTELEIWNDSQTPVNQVLGVYKVKQDHLRPLVDRTWELGKLFVEISIEWKPRSFTSRPDALCRAVDKPC